MSSLPAFARRLCDDAAVFPPGLMPLPDAVRAHQRYRASALAGFVGPLVIAAPALADVGALLDPGERLDLAVTVPAGPEQVAAVVSAAASLPVDLRALEVVVPPGMTPRAFFAALDAAAAAETTIFVEVPRDERRTEIIQALPSTRHQAKFRTGGVTADLYPDEAELAAAITAVLAAGVAFKATAGLHHAVRNTDPRTGFEQHGFLNVLLAVDAATRGADDSVVIAALAERDAAAVAARVGGLDDERAEAARSRFLSFGTCSITEPLTELVDLGLVPASLASDQE